MELDIYFSFSNFHFPFPVAIFSLLFFLRFIFYYGDLLFEKIETNREKLLKHMQLLNPSNSIGLQKKGKKQQSILKFLAGGIPERFLCTQNT